MCEKPALPGLSCPVICGLLEGVFMKRHEFRDRFSEASMEQQEKSGYVHHADAKPSTGKPLADLTRKLTSGIILKEPSPFGP
jgi:hypothetical protein